MYIYIPSYCHYQRRNSKSASKTFYTPLSLHTWCACVRCSLVVRILHLQFIAHFIQNWEETTKTTYRVLYSPHIYSPHIMFNGRMCKNMRCDACVYSPCSVLSYKHRPLYVRKHAASQARLHERGVVNFTHASTVRVTVSHTHLQNKIPINVLGLASFFPPQVYLLYISQISISAFLLESRAWYSNLLMWPLGFEIYYESGEYWNLN